MRKLSELEGVSLGIVCKQQPCTAYRVRGELRDAPSSHWHASAGSVYPLLTRLESEGLLTTTIDKNDGRGRKLLKISAKGRKALSSWVKSGADPELISSVTDPVRSRAFFLDVLDSSQRKELLDGMIVQMQHYLQQTRTHLEDQADKGDLYDYFGSLGAVRIAEARLDWLHHIRKRIHQEDS